MISKFKGNMNILDRENNFKLQPYFDVTRAEQRLGIYTKEDRWAEYIVNSIAIKIFPAKKNFFDSLIEKLMTLFSWKWVKLDGNTLINVNSVAQRTGLKKSEVRKFAQNQTLKSQITEKLTRNEKKEKIDVCKQNPVLHDQLKSQINCYIGISEEEVILVDLCLISNNEFMISKYRREAYVNMQELADTYNFKADLYLENGAYYINLQKDSATHTREFGSGLERGTWRSQIFAEERDAKYKTALDLITGRTKV